MRPELAKFFPDLGVRPEGVLLVHASLSGSGLRAEEVRDALLAALGPRGTLVVPAFTPENSHTSRVHRAVTNGMTWRQLQKFRASIPPYDPRSTPCTGMGALAECVRTTPGAVRSAHPQTSFAGLGARAAELLANHDLGSHLGERSPLARLYEADAQVLLLRVGFEVCSAFHLAEYRAKLSHRTRTYRSVMGRPPGKWIRYRDIDLDDSDFADVGARLPGEMLQKYQLAGKQVVLFDMKDAVDRARDDLSGSRREMAGKRQPERSWDRHIVDSGKGAPPRRPSTGRGACGPIGKAAADSGQPAVLLPELCPHPDLAGRR